ncbi:MAG: hypothetical protein JRJ42_09010 [Deltaproteobacteria bacterium]|nr:hypothetical protein [Deltaproteobacteria bacterium]MBW2020196.1 hypothetical protein [Deltaproteobacteria bacterium]
MYKAAAGLVAKRGYTNVMGFRDGIPGWAKAGYPLVKEHALPKVNVPSLNAAQLKGMLGNVCIVDVRTEKLYKEMGWIKGSLKIPLGYLSKRYTEIPKGKKVVVVDHAGKQVLVAGRFLKTKGYDDVSRLQGGLMAWLSQGYPLEK